jgi:two-component system, NtrC family, sensor kinase
MPCEGQFKRDLMAAKHYTTLRIKIVAMTLCFSLVPLFTLGVTIYYEFSHAYDEKVTEALRTMVQNRRSSLELFFDERVAQLMTVVNTQSLAQLEDEAYLRKVFETLQARSKSFIDLGVIDEAGNHLAYVGPFYERLKTVNYAHEDWFSAVMSSGVYVSDVFLGFRKVPHFIIAVTRVEGKRSWILRATINSDIIENIVRAGQLGKRGDAFIVNRNNVLQTAPRFSGKLLGTPAGPDFSSAAGTIVERIRYGGEDSLVATGQLNSPRWVLVVREDPSEQMTPLFRARYVEGLILAAGVLLVILGTVFTTRSMTNELIRIEHQKAASDELVMQSGKMAALGKMAAGIAHEVNNPLQIIAEKAGWMRDLLDKEDIRSSENWQEFEDCIKKIERQVERSRTVTHRLLRFGRRMEPTQEMVDVNQIISETITFLENEAHYRDIELRTNYGEKLPRITTDSAQLQQVFLNIVNNAIDAIGKCGHIDITTTCNSSDNSEVMVEIADNGPGIPKELLAKIFDPFFTTKGPQEGTGLGLSISYSIMEKLGGKITVASQEGQGTIFSIYIPVKYA